MARIRKIGKTKVKVYANGRMKKYRANYTGSKEGWYELSAKIKDRDGHTCRKCGRTRLDCRRDGLVLEVDHIRPVSRGGTDKPSNLWTLCSSCHSKRPGHKHLRNRVKNANSPAPQARPTYRIGSLSK